MADSKVFNAFDLVTNDDLTDSDKMLIWNDSAVKNIILSELLTYVKNNHRSLFSGIMSNTVPTQTSTGLSTWVNQGTCVVAEDINGLTVYDSTANSVSVCDYGMLVKSVPTTPYTITALFTFLTSFNTNYPQMNFGWRDSSSGKIHALGWNSANGAPYWVLSAARWSSPTAYVSADAQYYPINWPFLWLQLYDDGTGVAFRFGANGFRFRTIYSVAKSSGYLGSNGYNQLCYGVSAQGASVLATMLDYKET